MATTKQEINEWLENGKDRGATHVIVVCDTFDYEDYPIYVMPGEDVKKRVANPGEMQRVMEVYDLSLPFDVQLNERRAYHL